MPVLPSLVQRAPDSGGAPSDAGSWIGQALTATWSNIASPTARDWFGLYKSSTDADSAYIGWTYTTGTAAGSKALTVPANASAGTSYELRLFANNGFTRLAKSTAFTVQ